MTTAVYVRVSTLRQAQAAPEGGARTPLTRYDERHVVRVDAAPVLKLCNGTR